MNIKISFAAAIFIMSSTPSFADDIHPMGWGITLSSCSIFDINADPMKADVYRESVLAYWSALNFTTSAMKNREVVKNVSVEHIVYAVKDRCNSHPSDSLAKAILDTYLGEGKNEEAQ